MTFKRISIVLLTVLLLLFMAACAVDIDGGGFDIPRPDESHALTSAAATQTETPPQTEASPSTETELGTEPSPDVIETEPAETTASTSTTAPDDGVPLPVFGERYYDLTNVVLYLELYGELPPNFITKTEARKLGWSGGDVGDYVDGGAIGGDFFGNYEGLLPKANGRTYHECDIDTNLSNGRGARRLVFSSDGLYFYTSDHYESFSQVIVTEDKEVTW